MIYCRRIRVRTISLDVKMNVIILTIPRLKEVENWEERKFIAQEVENWV